MKRRTKKKPDVTEAFCQMAGDSICTADDVETARNRAIVAVFAWNISLHPREQLAGLVERVAKSYEEKNPGVIRAESLAHDLQILVDRKLEQCPEIQWAITKVGVEEGGEDHYRIRTESVPFKMP